MHFPYPSSGAYPTGVDAIDPGETAAIRLNLQRQHALGNERFRAPSSANLAVVSARCANGRPPKVRLTGEESAL